MRIEEASVASNAARRGGITDQPAILRRVEEDAGERDGDKEPAQPVHHQREPRDRNQHVIEGTLGPFGVAQDLDRRFHFEVGSRVRGADEIFRDRSLVGLEGRHESREEAEDDHDE